MSEQYGNITELLAAHRDGKTDATERLLEIAESYREGGARKNREHDLAWRQWPVGKRLEHALIQGIEEGFYEFFVNDGAGSLPGWHSVSGSAGPTSTKAARLTAQPRVSAWNPRPL